MSDEWSTNTEDWAIAEEGVYTENPEFAYVKTDAEDKILWAIKIDGGIYYGAGCPHQVIDYIEEKLAELSLDEYEDIVAFLADYLGSDTTLKAMIDSINERIPEIIESPEYLKVITDAQGKILCGIKNDGTVYIPILDNPSIDSKLNEAIQEFNEKAQQIEDDIDAKLALYDEILSCFDLIEDPEGRSEITTDAEGKVISYRDNEGIKHENVGIETDSANVNHFNLTETGMTEFQ